MQSKLNNKGFSIPVGHDPLRKCLRKALVQNTYPTKDFFAMNNMIDSIIDAFKKNSWGQIQVIKIPELDGTISEIRRIKDAVH